MQPLTPPVRLRLGASVIAATTLTAGLLTPALAQAATPQEAAITSTAAVTDPAALVDPMVGFNPQGTIAWVVDTNVNNVVPVTVATGTPGAAVEVGNVPDGVTVTG